MVLSRSSAIEDGLFIYLTFKQLSWVSRIINLCSLTVLQTE